MPILQQIPLKLISVPDTIDAMYILDTIISGKWVVFDSSAKYRLDRILHESRLVSKSDKLYLTFDDYYRFNKKILSIPIIDTEGDLDLFKLHVKIHGINHLHCIYPSINCVWIETSSMNIRYEITKTYNNQEIHQRYAIRCS